MSESQGILPPFTDDGVLPPGDYALTLDDLVLSPLVTGPPDATPSWDRNWRAQLVRNLGLLVPQLWQVGCDTIYIDGSFVENKDHPHDIDGYFECDVRYLASGGLERDLNALDQNKVWTWDPRGRRWDPDSGKAQLPMWFAYRVELYPHYGQPSGIADQFGHQLLFPSAFRLARRAFTPKGIVRIVRPDRRLT